MFYKVFCLDLKKSISKGLKLYSILFLFCILFQLTNLFSDIETFVVGFTFSVGIYGILIFIIVWSTIYQIIIDYYHTMFKEQAFFTHMIPIPSWQLLLSKILVAVTTFVVAILVISLSAYVIGGIFYELELEYLEELNFNMYIFDVLRFLLMNFLFFSIQFFCMNVTHTSFFRRRRVMFSWIIFFIIILLLNFLSDYMNEYFLTILTLISTFSSSVYLIDKKLEIYE